MGYLEGQSSLVTRPCLLPLDTNATQMRQWCMSKASRFVFEIKGSIQGFYSVPGKDSACPISVCHKLLAGRKSPTQQYYFQFWVGNRVINALNISSKFIQNKISFSNLSTLGDRIFIKASLPDDLSS